MMAQPSGAELWSEGDGGSNAKWWADVVHSDFPTIPGPSVGLPADTIYVRPSDGRLVRTV